MDKNTIKRELIQSAGGAGLVSMAQIGIFTGYRRTALQELCRGLDHIGSGKGKRFSAGDVAERIVSMKIPG